MVLLYIFHLAVHGKESKTSRCIASHSQASSVPAQLPCCIACSSVPALFSLSLFMFMTFFFMFGMGSCLMISTPGRRVDFTVTTGQHLLRRSIACLIDISIHIVKLPFIRNRQIRHHFLVACALYLASVRCNRSFSNSKPHPCPRPSPTHQPQLSLSSSLTFALVARRISDYLIPDTTQKL